jgi:hypothetical protein
VVIKQGMGNWGWGIGDGESENFSLNACYNIIKVELALVLDVNDFKRK